MRPYCRGHNADKRHRTPAGLVRAVAREDGFVSLNSRRRSEFWTVPFVLGSETLSLNVRSADAGAVHLGIERVLGDYDNVGSVEAEPIEGFALSDCAPVEGDHISVSPAWRGGALSALKGQTVRLHLQMDQTELYAIRF